MCLSFDTSPTMNKKCVNIKQKTYFCVVNMND